MYLHK